MQPDFYTYTADINKFLEKQDRRIAALEKELSALRQNLRNQSAPRAITVEKIEYKFDQLKIEKLEGTLNIGVNPNDIDDFITENQQTLSTAEREIVADQISAEVTAFIDRELHELITHHEAQIGVSFEGQYDAFIKNDLYKQLPERIQYYLRNHPYTKDERGIDYSGKIIEQIKTDISQAVAVFLQNIQNNMHTT